MRNRANAFADRRSESWVFAERGTRTLEGLVSGWALAETCSSTTRWQFVPLKPNELMAARRGPWLVQSRSSVLTKKGVLSKSMCRLGVWKWSDGGAGLAEATAGP